MAKRPQGKQTNSGRWDNSEHEYFLSLLEMHGKDWKKISTLIPTRSQQQVRSHAQKFYLKLNRRTEKGKIGGKFKLSETEAFYKKIFDGSEEDEEEGEEEGNIEETGNPQVQNQEETESRELEGVKSVQEETRNVVLRDVGQGMIIEISQKEQREEEGGGESEDDQKPKPRQIGWQVTLYPGSSKAYREWKEINRRYFEGLRIPN